MSPALLSLVALVAALAISMTSRINVGWLALAAGWGIGVYYAGMTAEAVAAGFPTGLFLTLTGVTLLFALAEVNGTLGALAGRLIGLARGSARLVPASFFLLGCAISSVGPGAISTVALLVPLAMPMGLRAGVPPLLTSLMVANGANAGNLSPFSSVGVIANAAMGRAGLGGYEGRVWFANFAAHVVVAAAAYAWLVRRTPATARPVPAAAASGAADEPSTSQPRPPLTRQQIVTLTTISAWIAGVLVFNAHLGLSAVAAAVLVLLTGAGEEARAINRVPWGIIMMVCGVSTLVGVLEKTGGLELFTSLLARLATAGTVTGVIAFVTGTISTYSSTSGVVLPAFLPTVPDLVDRVGGGDPLAVALSINVGSSLVDVSPLSTLGALCVAGVAQEEGRVLFRQLLAWGLTMTIVGAVFCQLFAPSLARGLA